MGGPGGIDNKKGTEESRKGANIIDESERSSAIY